MTSILKCGKETAMNDVFERRVMAAAVALWWVVLLAAGLLLLGWIGYLVVIPAQPPWLLSLWGPDLSWAYIQNVWLWAFIVFKLMVLLMTFVALWLTLWTRQLRKPLVRP
jgi:hypothetical protein